MNTVNLNAVLSRIDDIKSRFGISELDSVGGEPRTLASAKDPIKPFFPQVLAEALTGRDPEPVNGPVNFEELIESTADKYDLPGPLLKSLVKAESSFKPDAVSSSGAMGLTQLMPKTARSLGVDDPFDPVQNLEGGAKYLKQQLDRFGDVKLALAAYNAGPGAVARYGGIPPYTETQNYVKRVLDYSRSYGFTP